MAKMSNATRRGIGISIGQPDSGYTGHPNMGTAGLDLNRDRDVIDGDNDALDDLTPNPAWPLPNPGHGTATASAIVGQGSPTEGIVGLAGRALVVPIPHYRERCPALRLRCGQGGRPCAASGLPCRVDESWRQGILRVAG